MFWTDARFRTVAISVDRSRFLKMAYRGENFYSIRWNYIKLIWKNKIFSILQQRKRNEIASAWKGNFIGRCNILPSAIHKSMHRISHQFCCMNFKVGCNKEPNSAPCWPWSWIPYLICTITNANSAYEILNNGYRLFYIWGRKE